MYLVTAHIPYKELELKSRTHVDYPKIYRILHKHHKNKTSIYDTAVKLKNICMYDLADESLCMGCQFVKKLSSVKTGTH